MSVLESDATFEAALTMSGSGATATFSVVACKVRYEAVASLASTADMRREAALQSKKIKRATALPLPTWVSLRGVIRFEEAKPPVDLHMAWDRSARRSITRSGLNGNLSISATVVTPVRTRAVFRPDSSPAIA